MKSLLLSISLALCAAFAASAGVNISTCQSITYGDYYELTAPLTGNGSNPCLDVSNITGTTTVEINCNGYSIEEDSYDSLYAAPALISGSNNTPRIYIHNCILTYPHRTKAQIAVDFSGSYVDFQSSAVYNGFLSVAYCGSGNIANVYNNHFYSGAISILYCDNSYAGANYVDSLTSAAGIAYGITMIGGGAPVAEYNIVTGRSTTLNDGLDDGIFIGGALSDIGSSPSSYTPILYGHIHHNTVSQVYDACIEFSGLWTSVEIDHNDCTHARVAGIGNYWNSGTDSFSIHDNSLTNTGTEAAYQFDFTSDNNSYTWNYFTNNYIYNNSLTSSTGAASAFGYSFSPYHQFGSFSGNTVTGNGLGATVYLNSASGISGSGNSCTTIIPSGSSVTCP